VKGAVPPDTPPLHVIVSPTLAELADGVHETTGAEEFWIVRLNVVVLLPGLARTVTGKVPTVALELTQKLIVAWQLGWQFLLAIE
jgi:hypothetical protein